LENSFKGIANIAAFISPILERTIKPQLEAVWNNSLIPAMKKGWDDLLAFIKPYWSEFMQTMADYISDWIYEKTGIGESPTERKERQGYEKIMETTEFKAWFSGLKEIERRQYENLNPILKMFKTFGDNLTYAGLIPAETKKELIDKFMKDYKSPIGPADFPPTSGPVLPAPVSRNFGSLGATGKMFEDFGSGTPAMLHGKESVVTPEQMNSIISNASSANQNSLADSIRSLNNLTGQMINILKENTEYTKKQYNATLDMSGNLWAA
jgi:hypothetical protein